VGGDLTAETKQAAAFLDAGEMGRRIAAHDWSATLGSIEGWPGHLKTTVGLILKSPVPIVLLWGEDGIMLYNDSYAAFAGDRHPSLLGAKVREGWPEVEAFNDNVMRVGLAGGALAYEDQELTLLRHSGLAETVWLNLNYSPVVDEDGRPGGVMAIVVETTARVLSDRRAAAEQERQRQLFSQMPGFVAVLSGRDLVFEYVNEAYVAISERSDFLGRTMLEVFPDLADQAFFTLLDQVYLTGEAFVARGMELRLHGSVEPRYIDFIFQPIRDEDGKVTGIFIGGYEVTEGRRAAARREALVRLTDALGELDDPLEVQFEASAILGETLGVSRAGYGAVNADTDTLIVHREWTAGGIPSQAAAGELPLRAYGSFVEDLKRGDLIVIGNVDEDPRTASAAAALKSRYAHAFVVAPVMEKGRLVALLYATRATARDWADDDLTFMREMAARTRTASERIANAAALRESEARLRFLDGLAWETAKLMDADAVLATTTRMVGEYLGISVCAYADMDEDEDGFTIRGDWAAPGAHSIVGHYRLADFGKLAVEKLAAGQPLIINDTLTEIAPDEAATFQNIGIAATICMPLVKEGRLTALMAIHDKAPRQWSDRELALIREVTERSWAHVERVGATVELRASEENFRTLARTMPNHVWTAPPTGQLDWFNEQVYVYSGAEPGALDGDGWIGMVHPDDVESVAARWGKSLDLGETYEAEFRLRRADGAYRWHIARAAPVRGGDGQVIRWIGANTDIHDQKEIAAALTDLNATLEQRVEERTQLLLRTEEALRQAQKMEAVGQLTGGIAHDFNNLLAGISGSLEMLERRLADGKLAGVERYIDAAQGAARRAAALTQRLLAFSRQQTLDPKPTDANRLISGMEDLIRRSVGPDVEVEVVGAGGLWTTRVDPSQLENALLNLCINARDAMAPDGGRLTIETANKWLDETAAKERELPAGQYISLCVTDTGTGMTPDVIARAFDPFFTTKPIGAGTGLGLSMIYGFVRQSGGQVRIYSEVGKGTTMCLYLPRHTGPADQDEAQPKDERHPGHGETVLVIDDEEIVRMLIVDVLEENGYAVLQASDGPSGLKILQSDARVDLLITDVGLPGGMNGRQVADLARLSRPDLKVLFITGYAENAVVGNGHLDRGMEVVTKPFSTSALGGKVRDLIDR